MEVIPETCLTH